jgi:membrane protease YdiL (CAAX protease family)
MLLLLIAGATQLLLDTWLRLLWPPGRLRNLHATLSIASALPLMGFFAMMMPDSPVTRWAAAVPDWVTWLPPGAAVRALAADDRAGAAGWGAVAFGEALLVVAVVFAVLHRQLRSGVVAAGARESGRAAAPPRARALPRSDRRSWLSPVQRRELRLLSRDRAFMVQTLVLPLSMVGAQLVLGAGTPGFAELLRNPAFVALFALMLAEATLMFSAFQTLNSEGQGLWLLHCVPRSIESVVRQKAAIWTALASTFPLLIFAVALSYDPSNWRGFIVPATVVLFGIPVFAVITMALGVLGSDPLAPDVRMRIPLGYTYLSMLLATLYAYAIFTPLVWHRVATIVLMSLVALALWQKARDQFPYLLDPAAAPPARVSVADGLIAALLFFVLQAVAMLMQGGLGRATGPEAIWIAFCAAGALTFGAMRLVYWRTRATGVPRMLGPGLGRALLSGLVGGAVATLAGFAYVQALVWTGFAAGARETGGFVAGEMAIWLAAVAIAAAPVFEEFIFRGLIFGGLRRSLGLLPAALASAAIFAIVHPPVSWLPVFVMGLCAALVYERTRLLAAPIVVHGLYNGLVVAAQWAAL